MQERHQAIQAAKKETFDLLIIGGGITGAGIALDAVTRGLKTILIEKEDFASGTSSKSTKLIHGGLRYLQEFEFGLVREVGKERSLIHSLAPHLVIPEKMILPLVKNGKYGKLGTWFGLWFYDRLASVRKEDRRKMLSRKNTIAKEPLLDINNLTGAGYYSEYRTDDARLTIEVIKTAAGYGAQCINYCKLDKFEYENQQITGAHCTNTLTGEPIMIRAKKTVNATGPWADYVRKLDADITGKRLHLTKGIHLVVPHEKLPLKQSVYFDAQDGRMIFAIPRLNTTYIGTTDTDFNNHPDECKVDAEDLNYLLNTVNHFFTSIKLDKKDIISSWAGSRPLIHEPGKSASEISRKDEIFESDSGLITIAGGKLTGYRVMAKKTLDRVIKRLPKSYKKTLSKCKTKTIALVNPGFTTENEINDYKTGIKTQLKNFGFNDSLTVDYLVSNYGKQTDEIIKQLEIISTHNQGVNNKNNNLLEAELNYCIQNEFALTLVDFFDRRTARLYFDPTSVDAFLNKAAKLMGERFDWSDNRIKNEIEKLNSLRDSSNS